MLSSSELNTWNKTFHPEIYILCSGYEKNLCLSEMNCKKEYFGPFLV